MERIGTDKPGIEIQQQPEDVARAARLYYVNGEQCGYSRKPWGRGFAYLDNEVRPLTSTDVNSYLNAHTNHNFTAKDIRTWGATVLAASILRQAEAAPEKEREKQVKEMVKQVAAALGNTPAVCRPYYIHPAVIEAHLAGTLQQKTAVKKPIEGLSLEETAVLQLLHS